MSIKFNPKLQRFVLCHRMFLFEMAPMIKAHGWSPLTMRRQDIPFARVLSEYVYWVAQFETKLH